MSNSRANLRAPLWKIPDGSWPQSLKAAPSLTEFLGFYTQLLWIKHESPLMANMHDDVREIRYLAKLMRRLTSAASVLFFNVALSWLSMKQCKFTCPAWILWKLNNWLNNRLPCKLRSVTFLTARFAVCYSFYDYWNHPVVLLWKHSRI